MNVFDISINLSHCSRDCNMINCNRVIIYIYNICIFFLFYITLIVHSNCTKRQIKSDEWPDVSLILKLESSLISSNFSINLILRDIQTFHNIFHPTWFAKDIRRWKRGRGRGGRRIKEKKNKGEKEKEGFNGEFAAACVSTIAKGHNCSLNMHVGCGYRGWLFHIQRLSVMYEFWVSRHIKQA